jgi:molybdate/tungstate transport system substrate-binding protein
MVRTVLGLSALTFLVLVVAVGNPGSWRGEGKVRGGAGEISGKLTIFHAGSLTVPFKEISEAFNREHPGVKVLREAAGSRACARKITDLNRACDVMASADFTVIDTLLIPEHADWNIKFAGNEMVIAFREDSRRADEISADNWCEVLLNKDVAFGRSDPNADPCGYRAILVLRLAEVFYGRPGLVADFLPKDVRYIRPKEVDLLALLEAGAIDYIFIYRSVAEQHKLRILRLPDQINLSKSEFASVYETASVRLTGRRPGTFVTRIAKPIVYGVTIPKNAPNPQLAIVFLKFLLTADKGGAILQNNGQRFVVPSVSTTFENLPEGLRGFALSAEQEAQR